MATWNLDTAHSELEFKVRHMMISTVKGQFNSFSVNLTNEDEDLSNATIEVLIEASSVDTKSEQRDQHLKGEDFFDALRYPQVKFLSTGIQKIDDTEFKVTGDLTIKDTTKQIGFNVELGGVGKDPWGNTKVGYTVTGKFNRTDFGLNWNAGLETGGVLVSDEVKFSADVQFVKG